MSKLRFIHVYWMLMALGAISALVVSPGVSGKLDGARAQFQVIFKPVSSPVRWLSSMAAAGMGANRAVDEGAESNGSRPRSSDEIIRENQQLKVEVANLSAQLAAMKELNADRRQVGRVLPLCEPFNVTGADPGGRQSLSLSGGSMDGLRNGQAAVYAGGIAGRVSRTGAGGAQVQLVTDEAFRATGSFARYVKDEKGAIVFQALTAPAVLVQGVGQGSMRIRMLSMREMKSAGLTVGDWVVLNDADWPPILQGYRLGRIVSIKELPEQPQFADIRVQPYADLMALREVMVMVKPGG
jgi:cell shape-determining protein MreC